MQIALIFILLLSFVFGLGLLARRLAIPYPIFFVIGGLVISFVPILPAQLTLDPNLIFFLFLPPLLYIQAFYTSWRDFRFYLRPILLLAIGLVGATTVTVAYVAHWLIPGMPLAAGFVLGAIVSPPDAIAAAAIARRLGLPRRVVTVLEGESLVNDATSLVIFKIAVLVAVGAATPFIGRAWWPGEFIFVTVGGIAVGLVVGKCIGWVRRRLLDDGAQIFLTVSLLTPYVSYLLADQFLHVSGVLAVVATGLHLGWEAPEVLSSGIRLEAKAFWDMVIYLLNGIVFVLIGLQLPGILHNMREYSWPWPLVYALVINAVCIVVRLGWIFPGAYLPRLFKHIRDREDKPDWRQVFIVGWAGMRGIVSLAAALGLEGNPNFPRPHLIQFLAFTVIFATLVFQGLTLPFLIRFLGVGDDGIPAREEREARRKISEAVFHKIAEVRREKKFPASAIDTVENAYREQALILQDELAEQLGWSHQRHHFFSVRRLNRLAIATQRRALLAMRRAGLIGDDVLHKIENELDLEEARLKT
ncbi:MAG TPA: Na+/H+ antiporter [Candidatus Methylacidiphilales bacterium]|jgi:CPA1 family monovalent cation:H+ antiporter|nr:Na+/H+ antiporter [Candidatus Methylacidiphilales bacterium]